MNVLFHNLALLKSLEKINGQDIKWQSNLDAPQTIQKLITIVGKQHVLTDDKDTRLYRQGRRYGAGKVPGCCCTRVITGTVGKYCKRLLMQIVL